MHIISCRTFLDHLKRSNLLTAKQFQAARAATREYRDSINLAAWLTKQGWLTRWQVQQLLAGKTNLFLGKYKLLDVLGQGGMGGVLKAEQPSVNRVVALKVMVKELVNNEQARSRFEREIRSAASLNHPNIVSAIDADCVGDRHFFVMEYVAGKDLKLWIKEYGRLPIDWSAEVIRQAALGLDHAHNQGLVHRDIKPSNVLVATAPQTGDLVVKILDLGLARFASEADVDGGVTRTGQIMGSPDYIAPEQAQNARDADIRSDIFGLGCTFFHMLTGELPFPGGNIMEKLMMRATHDAPRASSLRGEIPPALDQIVAKMLARNPDDRYQTPDEVAVALNAFRAGGGSTEPHAEMPDAPVDVTVQRTLVPQADTTLNDFFEQLTNNVAEERPSFTRSKTTRRKRKQSPAILVGSIMVTGVLVLVAVGYILTRPSDGKSKETKTATSSKSKTGKKTKSKEKEKKTSSRSDANVANTSQVRLAKWATQSGSGVKIRVDRETKSISKSADIPSADFRVIEVGLSGIQRLTESQLKLLSSIDSIQRVDFSGSSLTDEQLVYLSGESNLKALDLSSTFVTDSGIAHLRDLDNLESLDLRFTHISDSGIEALASLSNLTQLNLAGTDISNVSLESLRQLRQLKKLDVRYTSFDRRSVSRLKTSLPKCDILRD